MNAHTSIDKPGLGRPRKAAQTPPPAPKLRVAPSVPQLFALHKLERAAENVRHIRADEHVDRLVDSITAYGLLQPLIGYRHKTHVRIVAGGRRLMALQRLCAEGVIDAAFQVPVLVRDAEQAIVLSLTENLQQNSMSPVDECLAFKQLIDTGHHSVTTLARDFGFSEAVVKQRLRLADLAPPVMDALAAREITIDAAMAYAGTQDRQLQAEIFAAEARRSYDPHRIANIKWAVQAKGVRADSPVMRFLGTDAYEAAGGTYEDGLFTGAEDADRILAQPMLAQTLAAEQLELHMRDLIADAYVNGEFTPTITGYVTGPGLLLHDWGNGDAKASDLSRVDGDAAVLWQRIRDHAIEVRVLAGIDPQGAARIHPRTVFVAKRDRKLLVAPAEAAAGSDALRDRVAEHAAVERARNVDMWSARLGVGSFAGTPFEGRAYWPEPHQDRSHGWTRDGILGRKVHLYVFVPEARSATLIKPAERRYDKWLAERAARASDAPPAADAQARADSLSAMTPPAVAIVLGDTWVRRDDGSYACAEDPQQLYQDWQFLLVCHQTEAIGATFATIADFDAASAASVGGAA